MAQAKLFGCRKMDHAASPEVQLEVGISAISELCLHDREYIMHTTLRKFLGRSMRLMRYTIVDAFADSFKPSQRLRHRRLRRISKAPALPRTAQGGCPHFLVSDSSSVLIFLIIAIFSVGSAWLRHGGQPRRLSLREHSYFLPRRGRLFRMLWSPGSFCEAARRMRSSISSGWGKRSTEAGVA